ncbi:MAG: RcpC/CpaB family pilus assembly protein [Gemmatales bacterium]
MRASTMFAVIVAVLVGLGAAVAAKATGVFNRTEAKKEPPPIMVLAAANNIFEGSMIQQADVRVRPATPPEVEQLRRGELLPPLVQAATKRFAKLSIPTDAPIRKEFLEDLAPPTELRARVAPGMRAVNMAIPKHHAAGGLINVGDWVDIQLMAAIDSPAVPLPGGAAAAGGTTAQAAIITRAARVIAKRNSLWPVQTPLGPDCPVNFTLETNPYRAALIEFSKDKGTIVLLPVGDQDKKVLEARRNEIMNPGANTNGILNASYTMADSNEYREEDKRVGSFLGGNYVISEGDLVRIFQLKYVPPTPPSPESKLEKVVGITSVGYARSGHGSSDDGASEGNAGAQARRAGPSAANSNNGSYTVGGAATSPFRFRPPEAPASCSTCKTGKCGQK